MNDQLRARIAIGVGCKSGVGADAIVRGVEEALARAEAALIGKSPSPLAGEGGAERRMRGSPQRCIASSDPSSPLRGPSPAGGEGSNPQDAPPTRHVQSRELTLALRGERQAVDEKHLGPVVTLHTSRRKSHEPDLAEAASRLRLPLLFHDASELAAVADRVVSHSERVERLTGVGSLAEAAALAGAGEGGRLVVPKFSAEAVSCAVAIAAERAP